MTDHVFTSYLQYRREQGLDLQQCTCVAIRKNIPDQLHLGDKYLFDRKSIKNDSGQDVYVDIYNLEETFIGRLLTKHFDIDTSDVSVKPARVTSTTSSAPAASLAPTHPPTESSVASTRVIDNNFTDKPKVRKLF